MYIEGEKSSSYGSFDMGLGQRKAFLKSLNERVFKAGWQHLILCYKVRRWYKSSKGNSSFVTASELKSMVLICYNCCQVLVTDLLPQFSDDAFCSSLNWDFQSKTSNNWKLKYKRKQCFFVPLSQAIIALNWQTW